LASVDEFARSFQWFQELFMVPLQALTNLHDLFSGFRNYLWSQSGCEMTVTIRFDGDWHAIPGDPIGLFYSDRLSVCIPPGQGIIGQVDLTGDEDPSDEDRGTRMGDSTGVLVSLGEISLKGNKSWESNIGDSDNTGDGDKIAGKKTSMSKGYLVKLFEESGEMLPDEAEK
nr:hypothetical protein [Tanacetum cinerariifolium]